MAECTQHEKRPHTTDETLRRLLERLTPELRHLLEARENFKITINASAGHTFQIEVMKTMRVN